MCMQRLQKIIGCQTLLISFGSNPIFSYLAGSGSYMSILDSTLETLERITQLHKTIKETAQLKSRRHTNLFSDHILMKVESDAASTTSGSDAEFNVCSH